jgi:signal transduction histidine kinase/CRP-like cAMP-binding protein
MSSVDLERFLRSIFSNVAEDDLAALAQASVLRSLEPGTVICREGEPGDAFFIVVSGRVLVLKRQDDEKDLLLQELEEGQSFGEIALVEEGTRSATVRTCEPAVLLEIDKQAFLEVLQRSPSLAMTLMAQLTSRLRHTDQLAIMELRQANEKLSHAVGRLERTLEITRELTTMVSLEPLLHKIVSLAADLTGSASSSILLFDKRTGELYFRAASSDPSGQLRSIPVPVDDSVAGSVLVTGEPAVISDVEDDHRHYDSVSQTVGIDVRSLLAVPLQIKNRRIGVLESINKRREASFTQEDLETLTTLAAQAAAIIENAQLVEALRQAYERLDELDRMKSDFIAIASHELRTPLSLILGYAAVLRDQLGEQAGPQLDAVWRAAMRLRQIIETMLNLRYLETGEVELTRDVIDLRAVVRKACETYRSLAEANGLTLEFHVPDAPLPIYADRDKMRLVIDNLLSNAVKFTQWGGRVRVDAASRGRHVEVAVSDTGIGIAPDDLEVIFDRFQQVEEHMTRKHEGMGLGLAIVKGLVELHDGNVWAESVRGRGSRFVVVLPRHNEDRG